MAARQLRQGLCFFLFLGVVPVLGFGQGTPLQIGSLSLTVPQGWNVQKGADQTVIYSPDSTPRENFQVDVFPPKDVQEDARGYHAVILQRLAMVTKPGLQQNGNTGPFIWTRFIMIRPGSTQEEPSILYSAKSGSQYYGITVDASSAAIYQRNLPAFEAMMRSASLSGAGSATAASLSGGNGGAANYGSGGGNSGRGGSFYGSHPPIGSMATIDDYIFTPPPGWTGTKYTDAVTLSAAGNGSERCFISIYPMRTPGPSLEQDANKLFAEVYRGYQLRNQDGRGGFMAPIMIRGTSGQGWDYAIVKRGIGPPNSPEVRLGFAMVARLGDREAAISGLSKDPLVSFCFGELARNVWPGFFYSLGFRNWNAADPTATLKQRMAGTWTVASASVADQITFSPNGRYGGASARQQYNVVNNSEVVATTQGFFGDGAYVLQGNHITMKRDNGAAEPGMIRVEEESQDEGRTWAPVLYLMRRSAVDGSDYEVRYKKTR